MDGLMVPGRRHTTTLASRDHGGTGPSSAGPSLEPQTGPPLRGAPINIKIFMYHVTDHIDEVLMSKFQLASPSTNVMSSS